MANTKVKKGTSVDIVVSKGPKFKKTIVPDLMGITIKDAEQVLSVANLKLGSTTAVITDDRSKDGKIFSQSDNPQSSVEQGKKINVSYYQYKDPDEGKVLVPNFIGKTMEEAQNAAKSAGLSISISGDKKGIIISQDVAAGEKVQRESKINLTAQIKAPNPGDDEGDSDNKEEP